MDELRTFPWGPVLVTILPAVILSRMIWVYAVRRWLEGLVSREAMELYVEIRLKEEREVFKGAMIALLKEQGFIKRRST